MYFREVFFLRGAGIKIISVVLSLLSVLGAAVFGLNFGDRVIYEVSELGNTAADINTPLINTDAPVFFPEYAAEEKENPTADTSAVDDTAETTSDEVGKNTKTGKKLGKIISQYFSPYTANTSYNNVYLNNQSGEKVSIKNLLKKGYNPKVAINSDEPQVLIVHTHATENYMSESRNYYTAADLERTEEESGSVIGVGNKITSILEKNGISVIHDKTLHDSPSYSGSYSRSAVTVQNYLEKYDSIKVVLDIHRDAIGSGDDIVKPVVKINKKAAAQVMICVGSETGTVEDFPNWKDNLAFGLKLQQTLEVLYPGLARALFLANDRLYNQNLSRGSIIIEFGTNANTVAEAQYSAELTANALVTLFKTAG